jgi:hypothetical protein
MRVFRQPFVAVRVLAVLSKVNSVLSSSAAECFNTLGKRRGKGYKDTFKRLIVVKVGQTNNVPYLLLCSTKIAYLQWDLNRV